MDSDLSWTSRETVPQHSNKQADKTQDHIFAHQTPTIKNIINIKSSVVETFAMWSRNVLLCALLYARMFDATTGMPTVTNSSTTSAATTATPATNVGTTTSNEITTDTSSTTMSSRQLLHSDRNGTIVFYALSDGPFGNREREQFGSVLKSLESRADFIVHLGDSHERTRDCEESRYAVVADTFKASATAPTFVLPGDNDWYDCTDQEYAWKNWTKHFLGFQNNWPNHGFNVSPQHERPENFAFVHKSTLFVGLHIISASVTDWESWDRKVNDDSIWLRRVFDWHRNNPNVSAMVLMSHAHPHHRRYKGFIDTLEEVTVGVQKPIMYLQGDLQEFLVDRPFQNTNILRVVLDKGSNAAPTEITIAPSSPNPFQIKRHSAE